MRNPKIAAIMIALQKAKKFIQRGGRSFNRGSAARNNFNPGMRDFLRASGHKPSEYRTLYHGTHAKHIPAIRKQGLLPLSEGWGDGPKLLYLADRKVASPYLGGAKHGQAPALVKVRVLKRSINEVTIPDPVTGGRKIFRPGHAIHTTPERIAPQHIRSIQVGLPVVDPARGARKRTTRVIKELRKETRRQK
jgi:hypothetical protein